MFKRTLATNAHAAVLLIRIMVGVVFLSEGIQKFLYLLIVGAGARSLDALIAARR